MSSPRHDRPDRQSPNVLTGGTWQPVRGIQRWIANVASRRFVKEPLDTPDLRLCPQDAELSTGIVDNRSARPARIPHASHMNQEKP